MLTDKNPPTPAVSYYGKKIYYLNPLIVEEVAPAKKEPEYQYEDIEDDKE